MPNVIVVPETEEFNIHVSHENIVWITKNLGTPHLEEHDARYLAPFWISEPYGVTRIYHILDVRDADNTTELTLGNSFVLPQPWTDLGQRRRFEYVDLNRLGFVEAWPGMLVPFN